MVVTEGIHLVLLAYCRHLNKCNWCIGDIDIVTEVSVLETLLLMLVYWDSVSKVDVYIVTEDDVLETLLLKLYCRHCY